MYYFLLLIVMPQLLEKGGTETQFLDCTNRFYTLVPHDFGLKKPPLLKSADVIKVKFVLYYNLECRKGMRHRFMFKTKRF